MGPGKPLQLQKSISMGMGLMLMLLSLTFTASGQEAKPSHAETAPPQTENVQPLPPKQTLMVHGHKLAYYEAGKGSVVILIHGLGADSHHWAANIEALSRNFRVIALDQIGYGKSDK